MEKVHYLKFGDRLQINQSSGSSSSTLNALLKIQPLLFRVGEFGGDGSIPVICHYPPGININHLPRNQNRKPYWADSKEPLYGHLTLFRPKGSGIVITAREGKQGIDMLAERPIIVEPFRTKDDARCQVFIAADLDWDIEKEEISGARLAADPASIPNDLLALCRILDEPLKGDEDYLTHIRERLINLRKLMKWFSSRLLSESVKEWSTLTRARIEDRIKEIAFKVEAQKNIGKGKLDDLSSLKTELGEFLHPKTVQKVIDIFISTNGDSTTQDPINVDDVAMQVVKKAMKNVDDDLPVHQCKNGHQAEVKFKNIAADNGPKRLWFVQCKECSNQSQRNDWGEKAQVVSVWNKHNPQDYKVVFPKVLNLSGLPINEVYRQIKEINSAIGKVMEASAKGDFLPFEVTDEGRENLVKLSCWTRYIKNALKHTSG
tara:strand:+ start:5245 stop:6540 length:1296 start_codon:yes stop_codon:yes gene_type:complete